MTINAPSISTTPYAAYAEQVKDDTTARPRSKRGVAFNTNLWPQHSVLTISLLNMTPEQKKLATHTIKQWAPYTNLYLKFINTPYGDIRITADNTSIAGWSAVGTDARKIPAREPTMSIGFAGSPFKIKQNMLHEFGHALGLRHEHQHPDRTLNFNYDEIYKFYESHDLTSDHAYFSVIRMFNPADVITSAYDQKSIMHYAFPASQMADNEAIEATNELSDGDKAFVQSLYPMDPSPLGKLLNTLTKKLITS